RPGRPGESNPRFGSVRIGVPPSRWKNEPKGHRRNWARHAGELHAPCRGHGGKNEPNSPEPRGAWVVQIPASRSTHHDPYLLIIEGPRSFVLAICHERSSGPRGGAAGFDPVAVDSHKVGAAGDRGRGDAGEGVADAVGDRAGPAAGNPELDLGAR